MKDSDRTVPWVLMRVRDQLFAVPADQVREMAELPAVTRVPKAPPYVLGLITIRGQVIPTIDLRRRLGLPEADPREVGSAAEPAEGGKAFGRIAVVLERGGRRLGVTVDQVESIERLKDDSLEELRAGESIAAHDLTRKVGKRAKDDALVLILDVAALFRGDSPAAADDLSGEQMATAQGETCAPA